MTDRTLPPPIWSLVPAGLRIRGGVGINYRVHTDDDDAILEFHPRCRDALLDALRAKWGDTDAAKSAAVRFAAEHLPDVTLLHDVWAGADEPAAADTMAVIDNLLNVLAHHFANVHLSKIDKAFSSALHAWVLRGRPMPPWHHADERIVELEERLAACKAAAEGASSVGWMHTRHWSPAFQAVFDLRNKHDDLARANQELSTVPPCPLDLLPHRDHWRGLTDAQIVAVLGCDRDALEAYLQGRRDARLLAARAGVAEGAEDVTDG